MTHGFDWQFTTDDEFPPGEDDFCVCVGAGDDCYCADCQRFEAEFARRATETYWRARIAAEATSPRRRRAPVGTMLREDARKDERDALAREIADSEALMRLMTGADHPDVHLAELQRAYAAYTALDGGFDRWSERHVPLTGEEEALLDEQIRASTRPAPSDLPADDG